MDEREDYLDPDHECGPECEEDAREASRRTAQSFKIALEVGKASYVALADDRFGVALTAPGCTLIFVPGDMDYQQRYKLSPEEKERRFKLAEDRLIAELMRAQGRMN